MGMQSFMSRYANVNPVQVPHRKRKTVSWLPQIGEIFPDFTSDTTKGHLNFWDWAEGKWVFLFSQPTPSKAVCSEELVLFADMAEEWEAADVNLLAIGSVSKETQLAWHEMLKAQCDCEIDFPVVIDESGRVAETFGMRQLREASVHTIRRSFVIDPNLRIRMIFDYPSVVPRNPDEVLRVILSLKEHESQIKTVMPIKATI